MTQPGFSATQPSDGLASVISIDRRDDLAAICGRIDTAPTYAVVVHAPDGNRQLSTQLGMRRLVRHVEETGRIVAIATSSRSLAGRARGANVAVARQPELVRWDSAGRRVARLGPFTLLVPAAGRYVRLILIAGLMAAAVMALLTVAPSADVRVTPPITQLEERVKLVASRNRESTDFDSLSVPASEVESSHTITLAAKTTGKASVGTRKARVLVSMVNTGTSTVVVPVGLILLAAPNDQPFAIDQETTIEAGKTATQQASAVAPGPAGNVAAGSVTKVQDGRFSAVRVSNAQPGVGGVAEERPGVAAADVTALTALAKGLESAAAIKQLVLKGRPLDGIVLRTARVVATAGTITPAVGQEGDTVLMDVRVTVTALAVRQATLEALAARRLAARAEGGVLVPGTAVATETGAGQLDADENYTGEFLLAAAFTRGFTEDTVREAVLGKSEAAARSRLRERFGIEDAKIGLTPGWAPWLPRFGFRVKVQLEAAATPPPTATPTNATTSPPTRSPATAATPAATPRP